MRLTSLAIGLAATLCAACATEPVSSGAAGGKACAAQAECAATEVCAGAAGNRRCGADLPRTYRITLEKATDFSSYGDDGKPWDSDGSGPDPYVEVTLTPAAAAGAGAGAAPAPVAATPVCKSAVLQSTDAPVWNLVCSVPLTAGASLTLSVWDEDGETDGVMMQVPFAAEEVVKILRDEGGAGVAKSTSRLWFKVEAP